MSPQMAQIDENQEAMAVIKMAVDLHDNYVLSQLVKEDENDGGPLKQAVET